MTITKPNIILFDWDGTLVDTYEFLTAAHSHVRGRFGLPVFKEGEYEQYFGKPREELYRIIYGDENFEAAKVYFQDYVLENQDKIQPLQGADALLKALAGWGIPMGVVSNKRSDYIRTEIGNFGWQSYFQTVIGAGDAPQDKPSPEPIYMALKAFEGSCVDCNEAVWFVGDTESDLKAAQNAGCASVFIGDGRQDKPYRQEYSPFLMFLNCDEFLQTLLQSFENTVKQGHQQ